MKPNPQLLDFLKPYNEEIQKLALALRDHLTSLVPEANELIWDNYNALAMAYSKSEVLKDAFCHIAVYGRHVNFGFNRGAEFQGKFNLQLEGKGKLIRHIKVRAIEAYPMKEIEPLIWEALRIADSRNEVLLDKTSKGKSIVMSIAEKKLRPTK